MIKNEVGQDLKDFGRDLKALADEVRVKVHLAGMDLKDEWARLEPQLDRAAGNAAVVSGEVMADLKKRLTELKERLAKP